jgi:hypothetical protein
MNKKLTWGILAFAVIALLVGSVLVPHPFSAGEFARNYFAAGNFSIGVFAAGHFAVGIFAAGTFAAGVFSAGIFSLGLFSSGIFSLGLFAVGIFVTAWKARKARLETEESEGRDRVR